MRLPNGYGSVSKLSGKRRNPYIVRKTTGWTREGKPIFEIIGYTPTREEGLALLAQYNHNPWDIDTAKITLEELFELWKEKKSGRFSKATVTSMRYAFTHCKKYSTLPYRALRAYHMQDTIDNCGRGYSTQGKIKSFWGHMDDLALELDIITKGYARLTVAASAPQMTTRDRFSDEVIDRLWEHQAEPWVDSILILIYSGWRISEFLGLKKSDVDLDAGIMKGGIKTDAGKNRVVPIHSLIRPFIEARMAEPGEYLIQHNGKQCTKKVYWKIWKALKTKLNFPGTPHCCRHTFESLLDSAGANRRCIDLMMGHVSKDTGNRIYNHKTISELRSNIELVTHLQHYFL